MDAPTGSVRLIDVFERIAASRRRVVRNHIVVAVAAVTIAVLLPKWYAARAVIFPPDQKETQGLESVLSSPATRRLLSSISLEGSVTPNTILIGMLKSRAVGLAVIDSLDLLRPYKAKNREKAFLKFRKRLVAQETPEGFVEVRVEDHDPALAARIANACVEELQRLSLTHNRSRAHQSRVFVQTRVDSTRAALAASMDSLRAFQESTGLIEVTEQTKGLIELVGRLLEDRTTAEVRLGSLRAYSTEQNPVVRELATNIAAINRQLEGLQFAVAGDSDRKLLIPMEDFPAEASRYVRLLLDVKTQEESFLLLAGQLEKARIDEARETTRIDLLDPATPPIKKSRPKRAVVVLAILLASVAFHIVYYAAAVALASGAEVDRWRAAAARLAGPRGE